MFHPFHAELKGIGRLYRDKPFGAVQFVLQFTRRHINRINQRHGIVAGLIYGTNTQNQRITRRNPADGIRHKGSLRRDLHGVAGLLIQLAIAVRAARIAIGVPFPAIRIEALNHISRHGVVANLEKASIRNFQNRIDTDSMFYIKRIDAPAPENAQTVVAV